jgi:hypothetical protein
MNPDSIYSKHVDLFMHYSGRLYAARVTILSVATLLVAMRMGVWTGGDIAVEDSRFGVLAAAFIAVLWLLEMAYYKKLNEIMVALKALESGSGCPRTTFISGYVPYRHLFVYLAYWFVIALLLSMTKDLIAFRFVFGSVIAAWMVHEFRGVGAKYDSSTRGVVGGLLAGRGGWIVGIAALGLVAACAWRVSLIAEGA